LANRQTCELHLTNNLAEAVALAMRSLPEKTARTGSLLGAHPASVRVRDGVDLTAPVLQDSMDGETGHEIDRRPALSCWTRTSPFGSTVAATAYALPRGP
jgi:hypothetical protein